MKQSLKPRYTLPDGTITVFSQAKLKTAILCKKNELEKNGEKLSQQAILENISEDTGISFSAIKHWCAGHNAPSDLDKVRDLACALNVDMNFLLETEMEKSVDMNTNNDRIIPATDYSSCKNTIRSLYIGMVEYIEFFRKISSLHEGEPLKPLFAMLYTELLKARFDIPHKYFVKLSNFAANYLQQFIYYLDFLDYIEATGNEDYLEVDLEDSDAFFGEYLETIICPFSAPWVSDIYISLNPTCEYCKAFEAAVKEQHKMDIMDFYARLAENEVIIDTAYDCLENILADFREQIA